MAFSRTSGSWMTAPILFKEIWDNDATTSLGSGSGRLHALILYHESGMFYYVTVDWP